MSERIESRRAYPVIAEQDKGKIVPYMLTAAIITGLSDGPLWQSEKDVLVVVIGAMSSGHPQQMLADIEKAVKAADAERSEWETSMKPARLLTGSGRKRIIEAALTMALVDGPICPAEEETLEKIADWIVVSRNELNALRNEAENRSDQGEERAR